MEGKGRAHNRLSNDGPFRYQKQMEELLANNPGFIQPDSRRNEVLGWVTSGLQDFSLSRAKVEWGIRVPWDPAQTFYVWTDALQGYLTGDTHAPLLFSCTCCLCY